MDTTQQGILVWFVGMVLVAIAWGVLACRGEYDRSLAVIIAPLWPICVFIGALIGFFWVLTEFGAWIGRSVQRKLAREG